MDAEGLKHVAPIVRKLTPDAEIILLADNDIKSDGSNPGIKAAFEAARRVDGRVAIPNLDGRACDFWDVWNECGTEAVQHAIGNATESPAEETGATAEGEETDAAVFARLAKLPLVEYDRCREREARALGIRVGTLDAEVSRLRPPPESSDKISGSAITFDDIDPWGEPIDGAALLDALAETMRKYVILPGYGDIALALWVVFTFTYEAAYTCPILALTSPEKRCGKSTVMAILRRLCYRAQPTSNITSATLFRLVDRWQPCLLIDEADSFVKLGEELRGVINSGHTRDLAYVLRLVGDDFEPRKFSTWGPKAFACIGKAPDTIMDRSIVIAMRRKTKSETVTSLRVTDRFDDLCAKCVRWAADQAQALKAADPELPAGMHDRATDNWTPLLAIADLAGGEWPKLARNAARVLSGADAAADTSIRTELLKDISQILAESLTADKVTSKELADRLIELEEGARSTWWRGKPITPRQVANILRDFGITSGTRWMGRETFKGYTRKQFEDAFARYIPSLLTDSPSSNVTTSQPAPNLTISALSERHIDPDVTLQKSQKMAPHNECDPVTFQKGDSQRERGFQPPADDDVEYF